MTWLSLMLASFGGIFYVLVGYPLTVIGLSRVFGDKRQAPQILTDDLPGVTVVVAAYNEATVIADRIANLLSLTYPADRLSILVVADGSDDETVDIVRSFDDKRVAVTAEGPRLGKSAALSRSFPLVETDLVVFSDANNSYEADALARLVAHFADPRVGAVTGAKRVRPGRTTVDAGEGLYWRYESAIKESESRIGSCVAVTGEMLAVRTALLREIPHFVINDDFFIAMGVIGSGSDVVYEPAAVSWELASASVSDDRLRRERIVAGRVQAIAMAPALLPWRRPVVTWQVISHKLLRPLVPALAAVGFASSLMALAGSARRGTGRLAPLLAILGQGVFYGAAAAGRRSEAPGLVPKVAAYVVDSNRSSLIGAISYLRGQRNAMWAKAERQAGESVDTP